MTEPTTSFDLSTPERIADRQAELTMINVLLGVSMLPEERATLTRRRERILTALEDHMHAADQIRKG